MPSRASSDTAQRLLLDTHLLLWAMAEPTRLSRSARTRIENAHVYVSAASIWEIAIKASGGKLKISSRMALEAIEPMGFLPLPVTGEHAAHVYTLPLLHRDPFDRVLVAQAQFEGMRLMTNDAVLKSYGDSIELINA